MSLVLQTIKEMGSAVPKDVCSRVAQKLGEDADEPAFVRAVYRDLKQLADEGRLGTKMFASDGSPLDPSAYDTAKNVRIEYHMQTTPEETVPGWKIVTESGGRLLAPSVTMGWAIKFASQAAPAPYFSLLFKGSAGKSAVLQLPLRELPAKILICRESVTSPLPPDFSKRVAEVHGLRTAIFACSDRSVSRGESASRMGHAILQISATREMMLKDLNSKGGTFFAPCDEKLIREHFADDRNSNTLQSDRDPFEIDVEWQEANVGGAKLGPATLLRLGAFRAAVLIK